MGALLSPWIPDALYREEWHHSQFSMMACLHQGWCSTVHHVLDKRSGQELCMKVYDTEGMSDFLIHQLRQEVEIHAKLHHFSVVQFYAAWQESGLCYILLEYAPEGNLATELMRSGRLSERAAISLVVKPYLSVLGYLHGQGIIHRDLKPENMVIGRTASSRIVKLADFGLSIDTSKYDAMARTGTLDYMAPEVVTCPRLHSPESCSSGGRCVYGCAVDVWSLGVVVYELLVGAPPFEEQDPESTVEAILTREPDFPPNMSEDARDFISTCLMKDPRRRPTVHQLMGHPWLQLYVGISMRFEAEEMGRLIAQKGGSTCQNHRAPPQKSATWHASSTTCLRWEKHVCSYNRLEELPHTDFKYANGWCCHEVRAEPHPSLEACVERLKNSGGAFQQRSINCRH